MPGYYATDLLPVGTASVADVGGTYPTAPLELTGYTSGSIVSTTTPDTDNFIQGTAGLTGLSSKTANTGNSIVYGRGSTLVINNGNCLNLWAMYALPSAVELIGFSSAAGVQIAVGTSTTAFSTYRIDGRDVSPYGGWRNYIVDLRNTNTGPNNTGGTGANVGNGNSYFGATWWQNAAFKTAVPLAIDGIRYGRQTLSATAGTSTSVNHVTPLTSTAANFPQMAYYNDYNVGGTPTLSATAIGLAVDGGYHRFGSLQAVSGGFLARGILSLGTASTSVYFNDANRNINFEDMFLTYNDFNRIEVRNASSTIILNSCSFSFIPRDSAVITSGYAPATPRGNFEMIDNAVFDATSCSFTDMGTFIFKSNAAISSTTFRRCNQVTPAGGTFDEGTLFTNSNDTTGAIILTSPSDCANMSYCNFTNNNKAIKITTAGDYYFVGHQFSGNTWHVDFTGTGTCNIYPSGGCTVSQDKCTATGGGTITVHTPQVNLTFTGVKTDSEIRIIRVSDNVELGGIESTSGSSWVWSHAYGGTEVNIYIHHVEYQWFALKNITLATSDGSIPISQIADRQYARGSIYTPG